jgi:phosphonopyruvate decarboxylase
MGHASQIALAIALAKPQRDVFVLDGDGAAIMHLGAMALAGSQGPANFKHIILNNGCHESVGGQPTAGFSLSFTQIAKGCGYKTAMEAGTLNEIGQQVRILKDSAGPGLLEIKVKKGARDDLGRPRTSPIENKTAFMRFLAD